MIEGVEAHKLYTNFPGYDIMAVDPQKNTSCRIQVKSRWTTNSRGFPIRNFDCDFVVFVTLNRGIRTKNRQTGKYEIKKDPETGGFKDRKDPEFYVFPVDVVRKAYEDYKDKTPDSAWDKVFLKDIDEVDQHLSDWQAIKAFLSTLSS